MRQQEQEYIRQEAQTLFRAHKDLQDPEEIEAKASITALRNMWTSMHRLCNLGLQQLHQRYGPPSANVRSGCLNSASALTTAVLFHCSMPMHYHSYPTHDDVHALQLIAMSRACRSRKPKIGWRLLYTTKSPTPGCTMRHSSGSGSTWMSQSYGSSAKLQWA